MSVVRSDDEGEGGERAVGVGAELAGDGAVAGAVQQAEGRSAQGGHHGRPGVSATSDHPRGSRRCRARRAGRRER